MVYRDIKREDFDEALKSLGNDPAILDHDIHASHLQAKSHDPWYATFNRKWMELSTLKDTNMNISSLIIFFALGLVGVFITTLYLAIQIHRLQDTHNFGSDMSELKKELKGIQSQINEMDELIQEQHIEMMDQVEEIKLKKQFKTAAPQAVHISKIDQDEIKLKKWRHLGIGKNREGEYVLLHDGEQSVMFSKNQFIKPTWRILDFNNKQTVLLGPENKRINLVSQ